jgi:hypothetical protein
VPLATRLDLLERALVESHPAIIIPFDQRVLFVRSLYSAEFSGRKPEVAQTFNAVPGFKFLAVADGIGKRWSAGAVRIRRRPGIRQGRLGSFTQRAYSLIGGMAHIPVLSRRPEQRSSLAGSSGAVDRP